MKKIHPGWRSVITASLIFLTLASADEKGDKIIEKLQKKYRAIKDATVFFRQDVKFGATGAEQSFSGTFYMKKGNKYRIEMEDQTVVTDGESVWRYSGVNKQLLIDKYREDPRGFSAENILVNIPDQFTSNILGKEKISDRETLILKLTPKEERSAIKWMKLWIDERDVIVKKIQVLDLSNNLMIYNIDTLSFNTGLPANVFHFETPDGANVIDLRQ
jgi:outer membrane lipoprotein carrier protein